MPRYVTRPRAATIDELNDTPLLEGDVVYDGGPIDTGLLDADGYPIYRLMNPIGFTENREWE